MNYLIASKKYFKLTLDGLMKLSSEFAIVFMN